MSAGNTTGAQARPARQTGQGRGRLERFRVAKAPELAALAALKERKTPLVPYKGTRPGFARALTREGRTPLAVIAEFKQASPSQGPICTSLTVEDVVCAYAKNGASALSILTEEQYFAGHIDYLARARRALDAAGFASMPLLRKDFLFDPLQIEATAATPASAFLLIVRQTPDVQDLRALRELGERHGLEAVVEVFDAEDLELARLSEARIIQVNARDLETFAVDRQACLSLKTAAGQAQDEVWIAASGMDRHEHLCAARNAGYAAALVGTALMRNGTPGASLAALLQGAEAQAATCGKGRE